MSGPTAPSAHSIAARQQILAAALELFGQREFARVSVSAIAKRAGMSRPALYQYFESKSAVLLALVDQLAEDTALSPPRLEPAPTVEGVESLRRWVGHHVRLLSMNDRAATLVVAADQADPEVHAAVQRWVAQTARTLAEPIARTGTAVADPLAFGVAVVAMLERMAQLAPKHSATLGEDAVTDVVTRALQLAMFPETRQSLVPSDPEPRRVVLEWRPATGQEELARMLAVVGSAGNGSTAAGSTATGPEQPGPTSAHGHARRVSLLDAAATCFARCGYGDTNVDDITSEAGVSRTAFYHYWSDVDGVLRAVAVEGLERHWVLRAQLESFLPGPNSAGVVASFVSGFLHDFDRRAAVLRIWASAKRADPTFAAVAEEVVGGLLLVVEDLVGRSPLSVPAENDTAAVALVALVGQARYYASVVPDMAPMDATAGAITQLVCRGFLGLEV